MPNEISRERLAGLLLDPREDLDFEIKNWLNLSNCKEDRAIFAKAVLALANHGGGFIAFGLEEVGPVIKEADGRPISLDIYNQDLVNGIVKKYCDPPFHCPIYIVDDPNQAQFPIVVVPGGHKVPVRARRDGPHGNIVRDNSIYMRKPGPRSETPQSSQEWDELLGKCFQNRRDEMFDQIRDLVTGTVPLLKKQEETPRLEEWVGKCFDRWHTLTKNLPEQVGPRFPYGYYNFAYEIIGKHRQVSLAKLPELLNASVVRYTGWPPFWYPTRDGIAPYLIEEAVECWLGGDFHIPVKFRDPAHSDFWRINRKGLAFLLRGFSDDTLDLRSQGRSPLQPGTTFDLTIPIWRIGETLLHAQRLSENLFEGPASIRFLATYQGLKGRVLTSHDHRYPIMGRRVAREDSVTLERQVEAHTIDSNLPEIVHPLLAPLYALFDFFELPSHLVSAELSRLRTRN